jgi:hypothetical protein
MKPIILDKMTRWQLDWLSGRGGLGRGRKSVLENLIQQVVGYIGPGDFDAWERQQNIIWKRRAKADVRPETMAQIYWLASLHTTKLGNTPTSVIENAVNISVLHLEKGTRRPFSSWRTRLTDAEKESDDFWFICEAWGKNNPKKMTVENQEKVCRDTITDFNCAYAYGCDGLCDEAHEILGYAECTRIEEEYGIGLCGAYMDGFRRKAAREARRTGEVVDLPDDTSIRPDGLIIDSMDGTAHCTQIYKKHMQRADREN